MLQWIIENALFDKKASLMSGLSRRNEFSQGYHEETNSVSWQTNRVNFHNLQNTEPYRSIPEIILKNNNYSPKCLNVNR